MSLVLRQLKILEATPSSCVLYCGHLESFEIVSVEDGMTEKTCAACDCELDEGVITITIGGRTVEVCCDDCARKLKEAHESAVAAERG